MFHILYFDRRIFTTFIFQFKKMKRFIYFLLFVLFVCTINFSCLKKKDFPTEPVISFRDVNKFERTLHTAGWQGSDSSYIVLDSIFVNINFTDGDGDIGVLPNDTASDFVMKFLEMKKVRFGGDGLFHPYNQNLSGNPWDTLFIPYRVPNLSPTGQYKALQGEISARFRTPPFYFTPDSLIKYEITLTDRAGHKSNKITTDDIVVP